MNQNWDTKNFRPDPTQNQWGCLYFCRKKTIFETDK